MINKRDIGAEILEGIRELKAGKSGRITTIPPVADIREKTGLSQSRFATLVGRFCANSSGLGAGSPCSVRRSPNAANDRREESQGATRCRLES